MTREIVNKEKAKKKRGNPNWVKGGRSPNPAGRGPDDSSMRAAYEWALSLTPDVVKEILSINGSNDLARQFGQMPRGVQLKLLVALRVVSSIMFEPTSGMVNHIVDRIDGPNKIPIETWQDRVIALLREGKVTGEQVEDEFGADIATNLVIAAGLSNGASGETGAAGGDTNKVAE